MVTDVPARITYIELLREDLVIIRLVPEGRDMPEYQTGQFLTLGMGIPSENHKLVRRAYSIASHPGNRKYFEFVIRWVRKPLPGRVTTELFYASEGDTVQMGMPTGNALTIDYKLPDGRPDNRRIICVGGGTGIAPFVAFADHLRSTGDKREIIVLHGASYVDELSYKSHFTGLEYDSADSNDWNFKYRAAISRPKERFNRSWSGHTGRVESFFKPGKEGRSPLEELVGEEITPENTMIYICGYQGTIDGVMEHVEKKGFVTLHDKKEDGSYAVKYESYG
ncbi:Na -transporting NADH ubiquinone oxidoreductase subunit [Cenarchaeum symbiosum A]|uniref:ferredoxin--NADP(+) reductase n=1 Tax=Cenarchaeum symbiosum (strain A) TaxID=414004 RepID=A0RY60_CENSY|nr:Na -transporting NADH ubiquinone oxidoreductase subunit [Cenarchaeum symbiosum A]